MRQLGTSTLGGRSTSFYFETTRMLLECKDGMPLHMANQRYLKGVV